MDRVEDLADPWVDQVDFVGEHHILGAVHVPKTFADLNIETRADIFFYFTKNICCMRM